VETEVRGWFVLWIADGKITRRQVFLDRDEALEAAGLRE
jgi:ketosteroid isomerase-like protein